jgi:hypothetical protein
MDYEFAYDVSKFLDASIEKVLHTLIWLDPSTPVCGFLRSRLGRGRSQTVPARDGISATAIS